MTQLVDCPDFLHVHMPSFSGGQEDSISSHFKLFGRPESCTSDFETTHVLLLGGCYVWYAFYSCTVKAPLGKLPPRQGSPLR